MTSKLAEEFTCLGENTEEHIIISVPIEKEVLGIDKKGIKMNKNIS